jgi:2,3-bisphosphoglycerate-dependent phosphoglycerate mutase
VSGGTGAAGAAGATGAVGATDLSCAAGAPGVTAAVDADGAIGAAVGAEGVTRVLAIRHAQTDWNAGLRLQGHTDVPLNAEGRSQAARLAAALRGQPLDAVYTSDLARARDTARAVAEACGAPLHLAPALRERAFGRFEGVRRDEIARRWPDEAERWRRREPGYAPPDGGESLLDFHARCMAAATRLAAAHPGGAIALVAHGGVLDSLYRAAVGVPLDAPRSWVLANASLNRLLYNGRGFVLVGWNDDGHLR